MCIVLRIASWLRVGPGSRAGGCSSCGGVGGWAEGSEGVRSTPFARANRCSGICSASVFLGHMPLFHSLFLASAPLLDVDDEPLSP